MKVTEIGARVTFLIIQIREQFRVMVLQWNWKREAQAIIQPSCGLSAAVKTMVWNWVKVPVHGMRNRWSPMRGIMIRSDTKTTRTDSIIIATAVPPTVIRADLVGMLKVQMARSAVETTTVGNGPGAISPSPIHGRI
jgi:hypothetical protein